MTDAILAESVPLSLGQSDTESKGIWRARLIEADVEGSSGFYPAEVLRRDGPRAFPAGTHVYLDHPTEAEESGRPERSVRDLAGFLVDDARFEEGPEGNGLFARIQFINEVKDRIRSLAQHIGLSIRAAGEIKNTATGRVVRSIREGLSVDVVTRAGAGGRLVNMTEKAEGAPVSTGPAGPATNSSQGSDTGTLTTEVVSLRESFEQKMDRFTLAITNLTQLLKDKQREADKQLQESQSAGQVAAKLMAADLPNSSRARLAENYRPGQDLDESIRKEREYLKSVMRESNKTPKKDESGSGLGMTESTTDMDRGGSGADDFGDIEAVLSGKMF